MPKSIPTPISEVCDRWTIARLKFERLPESEISKEELQRQVDYYAEGIDTSHVELMIQVDRLYHINGMMWDAEHEIRKGRDANLGLEEIGRRALKIRDLNRERIAIKNKIVELTGEGFKDAKMNYA